MHSTILALLALFALVAVPSTGAHDLTPRHPSHPLPYCARSFERSPFLHSNEEKRQIEEVSMGAGMGAAMGGGTAGGGGASQGTFQQCMQSCATQFGMPAMNAAATGASGMGGGGGGGGSEKGSGGGSGLNSSSTGAAPLAAAAAAPSGIVADPGGSTANDTARGGATIGGGMPGQSQTGSSPPPPPPPAPAGGASPPPPPAAGGNTTDLIAQKGQVVVAPKMGDLRMVPFNMMAKKGSSVEFVWGAGPHTVTQSSAVEICNKTLDPAAFTASGMQQQGFKMKVDITDDTKPIWYYCSVPTHCQKGMFGVINMPLTQDPNKMLGGKMEAWGKQSKSNQDLIDVTVSVTVNSDSSIKDWGNSFDASSMPDWAVSPTMQNMLKTRQFFAANPQLAAAGDNSTSSASNSSSSTSASAGAAGASGTSAISFGPPGGASAASTGSAAAASASSSSSSTPAGSFASRSTRLSLAVLVFALVAGGAFVGVAQLV